MWSRAFAPRSRTWLRRAWVPTSAHCPPLQPGPVGRPHGPAAQHDQGAAERRHAAEHEASNGGALGGSCGDETRFADPPSAAWQQGPRPASWVGLLERGRDAADEAGNRNGARSPPPPPAFISRCCCCCCCCCFFLLLLLLLGSITFGSPGGERGERRKGKTLKARIFAATASPVSTSGQTGCCSCSAQSWWHRPGQTTRRHRRRRSSLTRRSADT